MADDHAGASTTANASGENKDQVPSPAPLLSAVSEKRPSNRRRCIRRPTYGIHHSPEQNLHKKRFPKSPLPGNDSCMRGELNAAQSPLTMSNCAQCEMAGSRPVVLAPALLGAFQLANKKPLPAARAHQRFALTDGIRGLGIWRECHPGCCCPSSGR